MAGKMRAALGYAGQRLTIRVHMRRSWAIGKKGELAAGRAREKAHRDRVSAILAHGGFLYSASYDGSVKVGWDALPVGVSPQPEPFWRVLLVCRCFLLHVKVNSCGSDVSVSLDGHASRGSTGAAQRRAFQEVVVSDNSCSVCVARTDVGRGHHGAGHGGGRRARRRARQLRRGRARRQPVHRRRRQGALRNSSVPVRLLGRSASCCTQCDRLPQGVGLRLVANIMLHFCCQMQIALGFLVGRCMDVRAWLIIGPKVSTSKSL